MRSFAVVGLAFGDESKGACVDKLCRELPVDLIVRQNGGCQTAHHVVLDDGTSHCFSQFGSGMLVNDKIRTHLSRFMLVEPFSMMREAEALSKLTDHVWERTTVDRDCVIVTPIHRAVNRSRELRRGENRHGSCGRGIGVEPAECMVFEGAQGVMLDEKHGTAPHNTWTNTTFENADTLLNEVGCKERTRIGCLRTYYTRHGAGPFPTEDNSLYLPELHNSNESFAGKFRVGHFDFVTARRALDIVGGVDHLAMSHFDYLHRLGWSEYDFLMAVEANLNVKVGMLGRGSTAADRMIKPEVLHAGHTGNHFAELEAGRGD